MEHTSIYHINIRNQYCCHEALIKQYSLQTHLMLQTPHPSKTRECAEATPDPFVLLTLPTYNCKGIFPWHRALHCPSVCVPTPLPPSLLKHSLQFILTSTTFDICSFHTFHQVKTVLTVSRRRIQDFLELLLLYTVIIPRIVGVPSKKA